MKSPRMATPWLLTALISLSTQAMGGVVHVDGAASAGGDGSSGSPFQTIAEGIAAAQAGDTVRVAGSEQPYVESALLIDKDLTIEGASDLSTVVSDPSAPPSQGFANDSFIFEAVNAQVTLRFLTIRDSPNATGFGSDNGNTSEETMRSSTVS